jgi:hypothetical protein
MRKWSVVSYPWVLASKIGPSARPLAPRSTR